MGNTHVTEQYAPLEETLVVKDEEPPEAAEESEKLYTGMAAAETVRYAPLTVLHSCDPRHVPGVDGAVS